MYAEWEAIGPFGPLHPQYPIPECLWAQKIYFTTSANIFVNVIIYVSLKMEW